MIRPKSVVVVPTRNRLDHLRSLLSCLETQTFIPEEVIVVSSSDHPAEEEFAVREFTRLKIDFIHSKIKSAAIQRNTGIDKISNEIDYLVFLDDDVRPSESYLESLLREFSDPKVVGVSGVAVSAKSPHLRELPRGLLGLYYRFFLLDSKRDGSLLRSGINIPVRKYAKKSVEVDWLIGCAAWRFSSLGSTRFEKDFYGQSLAEDVIFSLRMSKKGKLRVLPWLLLNHDEAVHGRAIGKAFWSMWVVNHWRLAEVRDFSVLCKTAFLWSTFGQTVILLAQKLLQKDYYPGSLRGIVLGLREIM